jgi:uncharacterized protein YkwD
MQKLSYKSWLVAISLLIAFPLAGCGSLPFDSLPDASTTTTESTGPVAAADVAAAIPADDCLALGQPTDATHQAMFDNLNAFRVANGLKPLVYSERLQIAADAQARDLYERSFFAHINPDGQNPGQRAVAAGFCHEYVGENIAAGQEGIDAAQTAWENSPSHRENMLEPLYVYAGTGFYQDPTGRMYWAQEMAYKYP